MCAILFRYYQVELNAPDQQRFEKYACQIYGEVCPYLRMPGSFLLVHWLITGKSVRGILITEPAGELILNARGLPEAIEFIVV